MSLLKEIQKKIGGEEITFAEFEALKLLVSEKCQGYQITQKKAKQAGVILDECERMELDVNLGEAYNPTNHFFYKDKVQNKLWKHARQNNWCGQFAGESQWLKFGRRIVSGAVGIQTGKAYGRTIVLYSYEQTEPLNG